MIIILICVKIALHLCTILLFVRSLNANSLILSHYRNDSTRLSCLNDYKTHLGCKPRESLSYINSNSSIWNYKHQRWSDIASQKHVLEKERYIRRKGPVGFQTIEIKEDPNVSNRTFEVVKRLKEKLPNANIVDIWKHFTYSGPIQKGTLSGRQLPAKNVKRPNYYKTGKPIYVPYPGSDRSEHDRRGTIKTERDIAGIRKACRIAREILDYVGGIVVEGIFTDDIDRFVHKMCAIRSVYPATLNYHGFPKSVCTSLNEVACHGIPDNNMLCAGDLLKVDLTIYCDGYYGDLCETFMVMPMSKEYNSKFIRSNYMGRSERNKMVHRSVKHNNLDGIFQQIILQTTFLKSFNHGIKMVAANLSLFKLMTLIFSRDLGVKLNIPHDEELTQIAKRFCESITKLYHEATEPYEGRIVGVPATQIPTYMPHEKFGKIYTTAEDPEVVQKMLDFNDENRIKKPYLFSPTFDNDVELMKITHEALTKAISICKPGTKVKMIGKTIEKYLKDKKCRVMSHLCGHGIGRNFHEPPYIWHEENDSDVVMEPGMVFTIEPIVTRSEDGSHMMWPDGWTVTTVDGAKTAQFEHTVLITKDGHEVLTAKIPSSPPFFWERPIEIAY